MRNSIIIMCNSMDSDARRANRPRPPASKLANATRIMGINESVYSHTVNAMVGRGHAALSVRARAADP